MVVTLLLRMLCRRAVRVNGGRERCQECLWGGGRPSRHSSIFGATAAHKMKLCSGSIDLSVLSLLRRTCWRVSYLRSVLKGSLDAELEALEWSAVEEPSNIEKGIPRMDDILT